MIELKTWYVRDPQFTETDIVFLTGLDINVRINRPVHKFNNLRSFGSVVQVEGTMTVELDTTTAKQETMLKLKYGTALLLARRDFILEGDI